MLNMPRIDFFRQSSAHPFLHWFRCCMLFHFLLLVFISNAQQLTQENTALVPVPKLEIDSYDWWLRHADVLSIKDSINPEIVLIGNSITHFWGGLPQLKYNDGRLRQPNGPNAWESVFGKYRVLNLGFGWDRTQNVLWRLENGEMDGLHPRM